MKLKKFLKYVDPLVELEILDYTGDCGNAAGVLFRGYVFDKDAKKTLEDLYKKGYELYKSNSKCASAIDVFPYKNEHNANLAVLSVAVVLPKEE